MKKLIALLILAVAFQACTLRSYDCSINRKIPKSRVKMIKKLHRTYNYKPYKQ